MLAAILKKDNTNRNNYNYISKDIKKSLIDCLSMKFNEHNYHLNIIINLLLYDIINNKNDNNLDLKELIIVLL